LEWHKSIGRVDRQRGDAGLGTGFIEKRYGVALDARSEHPMLGRTDSTRRPLLEHLAEIHHQRPLERRHIHPGIIG